MQFLPVIGFLDLPVDLVLRSTSSQTHATPREELDEVDPQDDSDGMGMIRTVAVVNMLKVGHVISKSLLIVGKLTVDRSDDESGRL